MALSIRLNLSGPFLILRVVRFETKGWGRPYVSKRTAPADHFQLPCLNRSHSRQHSYELAFRRFQKRPPQLAACFVADLSKSFPVNAIIILIKSGAGFRRKPRGLPEPASNEKGRRRVSAAHPGKNGFGIKSPCPGKAKLNQKWRFCGVGTWVPADGTLLPLLLRNIPAPYSSLPDYLNLCPLIAYVSEPRGF